MQGARNPSLSVLANEDQKVWGWKRTCDILRDGTWLTREPPCRFLNNFFYMFLHGRRLVCFSSNLHVTGFSSCRITTMIHSYLVWFLWWLRHGAIGPSEATLFGVNVDWIDFRIYTFESVIRLSFVNPVECISTEWSCAEHPETSFCACSSCNDSGITTCSRIQAGTRLSGVVFFFCWLSGEVKHIVHLIRWNLKAVYANWGKTWPRSRKGNNARPSGS